jgi:predicted TIM-barrel fold metal-dependent hydrolase
VLGAECCCAKTTFYRPSPDRPPRVQQPDGSLLSYTRTAWLEATAHSRAVGEVQTMRMEVARRLRDAQHDELAQLIRDPRFRRVVAHIGSPDSSTHRARAVSLATRTTGDRRRSCVAATGVGSRAYGSPPEM